MRTVLLCHAEDVLTRDGLSRWLGSFSELVGILLVEEDGGRRRERVRSEVRRSGWLRFLFDVLPFRLWRRVFHARAERAWRHATLAKLRAAYPAAVDVPTCTVSDPNAEAARAFLAELAPDLALARLKSLLRPEVFRIPAQGVFVLHPGVCPEYRNAHGCFWALASGDPERVGATLLRIDEGIDTGPVYGYYTYDFDPKTEPPGVIQGRVVYENLDAIQATLDAVVAGTAQPVDTQGRTSRVWGQPRLSAYFRIGRRA